MRQIESGSQKTGCHGKLVEFEKMCAQRMFILLVLVSSAIGFCTFALHYTESWPLFEAFSLHWSLCRQLVTPFRLRSLQPVRWWFPYWSHLAYPLYSTLWPRWILWLWKDTFKITWGKEDQTNIYNQARNFRTWYATLKKKHSSVLVLRKPKHSFSPCWMARRTLLLFSQRDLWIPRWRSSRECQIRKLTTNFRTRSV